MKQAFTASLLVLCILGTLVQPSIAQSQDTTTTLYVQVDYMRVPQDGIGEYVQLEQELFKPIHEERVRRGIITNWNLFSVMLATPEAPYNYVTVNVFDDFAKLENAFSEEILTAVHPDTDMETLMERTLAAREIVHTEIWQLVDSAQLEGEAGPSGRYLVLNYMSVPPGGGSEYVSAEQEVWESLHQARIDEGLMSGWAMYGLILPAGRAMNYNFGTVDYYDSLGDITEPFSEELLRRAHPSATEADFEAMMERTDQARIIYKSELWELIDATGGANE